MFELVFLKILLQISIFLLQTVPKCYASIQYTVKNLGILIFKPPRSKKLLFLIRPTMEAILIEELQNHCGRNLRRSTNFMGYQGYQNRGTNTGDAYIWVSSLEVPSLEIPRPGVPRLEVPRPWVPKLGVPSPGVTRTVVPKPRGYLD